LPVYNSLSLVTECIGSILQCTLPDDYHLHVIDDCSDTVTGNYLDAQAEKHPQISVCRNSQNFGFVKSCNIGITLGQAPYVVLINSDVIVTPDWLFRFIACAESDPHIASVNPLTNYASNINIPMIPGANFYGME
jgi:GT2 family glycosyltransferase